MQTVRFGSLDISRFILGSNPFSGFSHQGPGRDMDMKRFYTVEQIKKTLHDAQRQGVNTLIARGDHHVMRMLMEFRDEGGDLQWLCQTCPELGPPERTIQSAANMNAAGCYIHGGVMDYLLANDQVDQVPTLIDQIHDRGMIAGIAGHNPDVFRWAESVALPVDFYMCSYYNSASRDKRAEHVAGQTEWFLEEDRAAMVELIQSLSKPVIHYKILAAGRNDPAEAFAIAARAMRPTDAVCVGVYTKDKGNMLAENLQLLDDSLAAAVV